MKVYYKAPTKEFRIVKPDKGSSHYEFWVVSVKCIGTAQKAGTMRIITEDGQHFSNLNAAARHYLEEFGDHDLANEIDLWIKRDNKKHKITGLEMVSAGKWHLYCKLEGLDPTDTGAMKKSYYLDAETVRRLKL